MTRLLFKAFDALALRGGKVGEREESMKTRSCKHQAELLPLESCPECIQ